MESEVRERLRLFVKLRGVSVVAAKIGYKQSTFSSKLSGDRGLDVNFIAALLLNYPKLSAEWLLRGLGQMENECSSEDPELQEVCIAQAKEIFRLKQKIAELEGKKDRA